MHKILKINKKAQNRTLKQQLKMILLGLISSTPAVGKLSFQALEVAQRVEVVAKQDLNLIPGV